MSSTDIKNTLGYAQAAEGGKPEPAPSTVNTIDITSSMAAGAVGQALKSYRMGEVRIEDSGEPGVGGFRVAPALAAADIGVPTHPGFGMRAAEWHVDGSRYPMAYADQLPMAAGAMARPGAAVWHSDIETLGIDHRRFTDENPFPGAMAAVARPSPLDRGDDDYPHSYFDATAIPMADSRRPEAATWYGGIGQPDFLRESSFPGPRAAASDVPLTLKGAEPLTVVNEMEDGLLPDRRRE